MKKRKLNKRKLRKFFILNWKKFWITIGIGFASVIAHNGFYALFGKEEPVFFIIAVVLVPAYLLVSFIYSTHKGIQHKREKR